MNHRRFNALPVQHSTYEASLLQSKVSIQREVTRILAESESFEESIAKILAAICQWLKWDAAGFWNVNDQLGIVECTQSWSRPFSSTSGLRIVDLGRTLAKGEGLPGSVWASNQAQFVSNMGKAPGFPRAAIAEAEGIQAGFAFPIIAGDKTLGVIEFFSHRINQLPDDDDLAQLFEDLGFQIGQFMSRALATEALRETTERLTRAVSASKIGLWQWDIDGTVRWESGMYNLFGVSEGEFKPSVETFLECVAPHDRDRVNQLIERTASTGEDLSFDFQIVRPDGAKRWLEAKGALVVDENNVSKRMTGVCIDITDRKLMERALRESEQRLNLALESAAMGVWEVDLLRNETTWRSLAHDQIFGYESVGPKWSKEQFLQHVLPEDRPVVVEKIEETRVSGSFSVDFRTIHARDKTVHWLSVQGKTYREEHKQSVRLIGTVVDITERRSLEQRAAEAVRRSEQIAHAIVKNAPMGIVNLDAELKVTDANAAFTSMIGLELPQVIDQPLAALLPGCSLEAAQESIGSGKSLQISRLRVMIPDAHQEAQENYWDLSLWPILADGELIGAVLLIINNTHAVLLEHQRDDFVASVAHDIKNPLIGAERILEALCNQPENFSGQTDLPVLNLLRDSNRNLLSLVQNLVDVYRFETSAYQGHFEETDLSVLVDGCIKDSSHFAGAHGITLTRKVPESVGLVHIDSLAFRRVLMNLLHNAIKFNTQGGAVHIAVERLADAFTMSISDTGVGICDSDQQKLFRRFAQGHQGRRYSYGTGLGLYLSKQIIEAHGGTISCNSKLGVGTTFTIMLPLNLSSEASSNVD
jgi:PAS domain S-box-containing protein